MKKETRRNKIIELVSTRSIETQDELTRLLNEAGFQTTQATVSRDIKELHLAKRSIGGQSVYYFPDEDRTQMDKYLRVFTDGFKSIDPAGTIVVIRTVSGMAMAVAAALDSIQMEEIVGTIAGDDTIMCATRSTQDALIMTEKIRSFVG